MSQTQPIVAGTRIGHVHLKVADLDRALGFYCGVLGFELQQRMGSSAAFVSAGGYHHHLGLNTCASECSRGFRGPCGRSRPAANSVILRPRGSALHARSVRLLDMKPKLVPVSASIL